MPLLAVNTKLNALVEHLGLTCMMEFEIRRANASDANDIAAAHLDSIRSIGALFYPAEVVNEWGAGLTGDLYVKAMERGEVFYIQLVSGRSSRHLVLASRQWCLTIHSTRCRFAARVNSGVRRLASTSRSTLWN